MKEQEIKFPDTSDAEEWLTPDTFKFQGKVYKVLPNGEVVAVTQGYTGQVD